MAMRDYEEMKNVQIPKEQEEMMDIICDAWEECRNGDCKKCNDRPAEYSRMMICTAMKYTRKLLEAGYRKGQNGMTVEYIEKPQTINSKREELKKIIAEAVDRRVPAIEITYDEGDFPNITRAAEVIRETARYCLRKVERRINGRISTIAKASVWRVKEKPRTLRVYFDYKGMEK